MSDKLDFQKKLGQILEYAAEKENKLSKDEVESFFSDEKLTTEQMTLVYDYLIAKKVGVKAYIKLDSTSAEKKALSEEELAYLKEYETDLTAFPAEKSGEIESLYKKLISGDPMAKDRFTQIYLPRVISLAKEMYTGEMFIGDLIQEGNVALMIALESVSTLEFEREEEVISYLNGEVKQGIQMLLEETSDLKTRDENMVKKVMDLDESITKLTDELGRKVTIEELALYTETCEDEILEILKLTGEEVEEGPDMDVSVL